MTGPSSRRHLPFVLVDDIDVPALAPEDHHHFARVRRIAAGAPIVVGDGAGGVRTASFGGGNPAKGLVELGPVEQEAAPELPITIAVRP